MADLEKATVTQLHRRVFKRMGNRFEITVVLDDESKAAGHIDAAIDEITRIEALLTTINDWGIASHTASLEMPVKVSPFISVIPFYRYYTQTAADYFAAYQKHTNADTYYTSSYDLGKFNSNFYGAGIKLTPEKGIFGVQRLNMLELRYGHYTRTNGLNSDIVTLNLRFK